MSRNGVIRRSVSVSEDIWLSKESQVERKVEGHAALMEVHPQPSTDVGTHL